MEFDNRYLVSDSLPDPKTIHFEALAKRYRVATISSTVGVSLIFLSIMSIYRFQPWFPVSDTVSSVYVEALAAIILLSLLMCCYQFIAIPRRRYCLRDHDLHFSSGLIFCKMVSQPILRIQHVELKRGPIERLFKLATLQVFSAGGASYTFEIPGLDIQVADRIRYFLLSHKDTVQNG